MKHTPATPRRRGAVLLVVLAMLALFAVIGLSFVFYAESRATSARIYREAQGLGTVAESPDPQALNAFAQLIYGNTDGTNGVFSGLRGHDLARAMYGMYYEPGTDPNNPLIQFNTNTVAYGGLGAVPGHVAGGLPVVNFTWRNGQLVRDPERTSARALPTDAFNANSRYVGKNEAVTYPGANDMAVGLVNPVNGNVLVPSLHRPWVFNNSLYAGANEYLRQLALAPPAALGGPATKPVSTDGSGDDWTNANGRFRIIRPRPIDHGNTFPYPPANADNTYTGDVQNLPGAAYPYLDTAGNPVSAGGNPVLIPKNDSVWVDIGAPVQIWQGKRVKPLFAFLVVPTNNRVNVNSAGNMRSTNGASVVHDSGQGHFPAEVNPKFVLRSASQVAELNRMKFAQYGDNFGAYPAATPTKNLPNPNGTQQINLPAIPPQLTRPPGNYVPNASAPLDCDAAAPPNAMRMQLPGQQGTFGVTPAGNSAFATAPRWVGPVTALVNQNRYASGDVGDAVNYTNSPYEQLFSPFLWNPYLWKSTGLTGRVYSDADLRKLHQKWADDQGLTNDTTLGTLAPISIGATRGVGLTGPSRSPSNLARFSITTRSNSFALHNIAPQTANLGDPDPATKYAWLAAAPSPVGTVQPFADPIGGSYGTESVQHPTLSHSTDFERYIPNTATNLQLRAGIGSLPPLDVNRPLTDYRHALAIKRGLPLRPDNVILPLTGDYATWCTNNGIAADVTDAPFLATTPAQQTANLFAAMRDRQELAKDIFARLVVSTGASASYMRWNGYCTPLVLPTDATGQYDALRYLAQLAANMVDYIDGDDVATTFVWNPINPNASTSFDPSVLTGLAPTGVPPASDNFAAANLPDRVVVGAEKPKLVVNEVYAELTNNGKDYSQVAGTLPGRGAQYPLELRFVLELMNPSANDLPYGNEIKPFSTQLTTDPMQNAVLHYTANQQSRIGAVGVVNPYTVYKIDLYRKIPDGAFGLLADRKNVLGQLPSPEGQVDFNLINAFAAASAAATNASTGIVGTALRTIPAPNNPVQAMQLLPESAQPVPVSFAPQFVGPVGTKYAPIPVSNLVTQGYLTLAPWQIQQTATQGGQYEYNPVVWDNGTMTMSAYGGASFDYATSVPTISPMANVLDHGMAIPVPDVNGVFNLLSEAQINAVLADYGTLKDLPAVVVRRLANPYVPLNDPSAPTSIVLPPNPYVTVDAMNKIPVNDGVRMGTFQVGNTRPNAPTPTPRTQRASRGKGHPYAAFAALGHNTVTDPAPPTFPANTFFRHNGTPDADPEGAPAPSATAVRAPQLAPVNDLLLTPQGGGRLGFEWLVHMDRQLVNQLELLHVPAVPSHLLTQFFASGDLTQPNPLLPALSYRFQTHVAAWTDTNINSPVPTPGLANQARLYRALELLRVKPWTYAMPNGGRVPGKININLITDPNVLKALADPQSGDFFAENFGTVDVASGQSFDALYDPANPFANAATTFAQLQTIRGGGTVTPVVNQAPVTKSMQYDPATNTTSQIQIPGPNDKPFRSLGAAASGAGPAGFPMPAMNGVTDTPLNGVFDLPSQTHPYAKNGLLRKVYNNLTTTSEVYEVYLTVGFFEVMNAGPYYAAPTYVTPQLGKEVFRDVPGDTRHRYFAVVDRTNLSIDPTNTGTAAVPITRKQGPKPVFTDLTGLALNTTVQWELKLHATGATTSGPTIQYDETPDQTSSFQIVASATVGTYLKIGSGLNSEWVRVIGFTPTAGPLPTFGFDTSTGIATVIVQRNTGMPEVFTGPPAAPYIALPLVVGAAPNLVELPQHPIGSSITNVQLGNPGPQPGFDPTQPNYKAVMPYLIKLED